MLTDYEIGKRIYAADQPVTVCTNESQVRGWVDATNLAWWQAQQARIADHERLCAEVAQAVEEERTGRRALCVGYVEPVTREVVIVPLTPSAADLPRRG